MEACGFRDESENLPKGVVVLGISKDTVEAQKKFAERHGLKFRLLADEDGAVIRAYGVNGLAGYAQRKTVVLDREGRVAKLYESVNPLTHARRVREDLEAVA
jgi:thioredoxin-dependent peroxiredoxin